MVAGKIALVTGASKCIGAGIAKTLGAETRREEIDSSKLTKGGPLQVLIPETNKLPGVHYAFTNGGLELAILDITHPTFRVDAGAEALARAWSDQQTRTRLLGRLFNFFVLPHLLNRSRIGKGLIAANGTHLDALTTYMMKLGPKALGTAP